MSGWLPMEEAPLNGYEAVVVSGGELPVIACKFDGDWYEAYYSDLFLDYIPDLTAKLTFTPTGFMSVQQK